MAPASSPDHSRTAAPVVAEASVAERLIEYIRRENLKMGDRLPAIRRLAETLQVGPNAVRDALVQVQTRGLVRIEPRSGVFVQSLDFSSFVGVFADTLEAGLAQKDPNLVHLIEARRLIEVETIGIAALRRRPEELLQLREAIEELRKSGSNRQARAEADERFHLAIADIAGNSVMTVILRSLLILLRPHRMSQLLTPQQRQGTLDDHEQLYRSISERKVKQAQEQIRRHVSTYLEQL
jgi:GntR family transcriptional repressor for pyruvate dehydrogenase complex